MKQRDTGFRTNRLAPPLSASGTHTSQFRTHLKSLLSEESELTRREHPERMTVTFRRGDGRTLHVRKATRAEPDQKAIYDALGIDPAPGGVRKMIV